MLWACFSSYLLITFFLFYFFKIRCEPLPSANGDLANTNVLLGAPAGGPHLSKTKTFTYIFNDYTFNVYNYCTNSANSFLTLFHSILHYSSLDSFGVLLTFLRSLRESGSLTTDVQLSYMCALIGPVLHRIEKVPQVNAEVRYSRNLISPL